MQTELDALRDCCGRFVAARIPFMLTGSLAMAFYAEPRFTNDIDLVVQLEARDATRLIAAFRDGYYVPEEIVADELRKRGLFNFIHDATGIKLDLIPLKDDALEREKFARRCERRVDDFSVPVISREDLILSKLAWMRETGSAMQRRDLSLLKDGALDLDYLGPRIARLGLDKLWASLPDES